MASNFSARKGSEMSHDIEIQGTLTVGATTKEALLDLIGLLSISFSYNITFDENKTLSELLENFNKHLIPKEKCQDLCKHQQIKKNINHFARYDFTGFSDIPFDDCLAYFLPSILRNIQAPGDITKNWFCFETNYVEADLINNYIENHESLEIWDTDEQNQTNLKNELIKHDVYNSKTLKEYGFYDKDQILYDEIWAHENLEDFEQLLSENSDNYPNLFENKNLLLKLAETLNFETPVCEDLDTFLEHLDSELEYYKKADEHCES